MTSGKINLMNPLCRFEPPIKKSWIRRWSFMSKIQTSNLNCCCTLVATDQTKDRRSDDHLISRLSVGGGEAILPADEGQHVTPLL